MLFEKGQTILFQGDSVTDCGRSREDLSDLGRGYPLMIASRLTAEHPELQLRFINRGSAATGRATWCSAGRPTAWTRSPIRSRS